MNKNGSNSLITDKNKNLDRIMSAAEYLNGNKFNSSNDF